MTEEEITAEIIEHAPGPLRVIASRYAGDEGFTALRHSIARFADDEPAAFRWALNNSLARWSAVDDAREPSRIGPQERLLLLKSLAIAEGLPAEGFVPLAQHAVERRFAAGAIVARKGDFLPGIFLVVEGRLWIERSDRPAASIGRGEVTGAMEVMAHAPARRRSRRLPTRLCWKSQPTRCSTSTKISSTSSWRCSATSPRHCSHGDAAPSGSTGRRPEWRRSRPQSWTTWCNACSGSERIPSSSGAGSDHWFDSRRSWRPSRRHRETGCGRGETAPHGVCFWCEER